MTDEQIKEMISKEVLKLKDKSLEMCLRKILFSDRNTIDWKDAYRVILDEMPELINYKY